MARQCQDIFAVKLQPCFKRDYIHKFQIYVRTLYLTYRVKVSDISFISLDQCYKTFYKHNLQMGLKSYHFPAYPNGARFTFYTLG
jgi:hypothetical protein